MDWWIFLNPPIDEYASDVPEWTKNSGSAAGTFGTRDTPNANLQ